MDTGTFIPWLFGVTLVAAVAVGVWQVLRTWRSQRRHGEAQHASNPFDPTA